MGLEKVSLSLAQKTVNWLNKTGKHSVLLTKNPKINKNEFIISIQGKNNEKIRRYIRDGKQVGEIRYNIIKGNIGKYPEYYLEDSGTFMKTLKPSIFVSHLEGKRCGAQLMKFAARDAGLYTDKRLVLDAQCVDGLTSPDAFYYKLGLRKLNKKENEMIQNFIDNNEVIPIDMFSDRMYLPRENFYHLLNYKSNK